MKTAAPARPPRRTPDQTFRSLEELREAEMRLRSLTELSSDYFWETDAQHRLVRTQHGRYHRPVNARSDRFGRCRWELASLHPDAAGWAAHREGLERHEPFRDFEFARLDDQGNERWLSISGEPTFDARGVFTGYRGVGKDVTERKREEKLRILEHTVAGSLAEAIDAPAGLKAVLRAVCETNGWECGRYFRKDDGDVFRFAEAWHVPGDALDRFIAYSRGKSFARGTGVVGICGAGETIWTPDIGRDPRMASRAMVDDHGMRGALMFPALTDGAVVGVLSFTSREIRKPDQRLLQTTGVIGRLVGQFLRRKQAEEVLRESEARFRMLTKASSDWYWEQDAELRFVAMGTAIVDKTGISATGHIGKRRWDLPALNLSEADWAAHRAICEAHLPFQDFELCRLTEDGRPSWVLISGEPIFDAAGVFKGYRGVGKDITARKRAAQLRELEHTVTRELAAANSVSGAIGAAIRAVCGSEGWDCGRYFAPAAKSDELRLAVAWGIDNEAVQSFLSASRALGYGPGAGLAGRVWESGEPLWVEDTERDPRVLRRELNKSFGMRGAFVFPVIADGRTIGVLTFSSRATREREEALLQAIRVIGIQIGQFAQRKQAEEEVRASEERFRSLTKLSSDVYWEQDEEFRFTSFSGTREQKIKPPIGKKRWEQNYVNMTAEAWAEHVAVLQAHQPFRDMELCRIDEQGCKVWISVSGEPVFDAAGRFRGYRGVGTDITPRKLDEERIQYLATHDALTSLPNRAMFGELLTLSIRNARRYGRTFAVLFVDLDRFKVVNDTLGHEAGDKLLQQVAERLAGTVRVSDVVARLGGDEFVVLVQEVSEPHQAETVARKLLAALARPVYVAGQEIRTTASIGICLYPSDAQDEQALMKNADIAMYRAKEEGKNTCKFYSAKSNSHSFERLALETSLRRGLERGEFSLHYQAKVDLRGGRITGVEALLRWQHPELGMVPPGQFIPLAEETGLIVPIGKWVLRAACEQSVAWRRAGLPPVRMSVNISGRQFADEHLLADIAEALAASGLEPSLLELEITESMVMQDAERAASVLAAIKKMGVHLAIDDFGVGYSSLAQLKRLPIDTLKVDRSFIRDIPQDPGDSAIAEAIIAMGKRLRLTVVAEGVETSEQQAFLRAHDCDEMQGFFFSRPIPAAQFAELLRGKETILQ